MIQCSGRRVKRSMAYLIGGSVTEKVKALFYTDSEE